MNKGCKNAKSKLRSNILDMFAILFLGFDSEKLIQYILCILCLRKRNMINIHMCEFLSTIKFTQRSVNVYLNFMLHLSAFLLE